MLNENVKILTIIVNKYAEVKNNYSEALNYTTKIMSEEKPMNENSTKKIIDGREQYLLKSEKLLKEISALSVEFAQKNGIDRFCYEALKKIDGAKAEKIQETIAQISEIIVNIQNANDEIEKVIGKVMSDISLKLKNLKTNKKLNDKYNQPKKYTGGTNFKFII
ncbi:MAG: hypothetical protein QMC67_13990 [Candidatus Wallbacteria bacterium]